MYSNYIWDASHIDTAYSPYTWQLVDQCSLCGNEEYCLDEYCYPCTCGVSQCTNKFCTSTTENCMDVDGAGNCLTMFHAIFIHDLPHPAHDLTSYTGYMPY